MKVTIKTNARAVTGQMNETQRRMLDLSVPLRVGAAALDKSIDDSFRRQRGPAGVPWDKLKKSTIKKRRKGSARILQDTARLRRSWNARSDRSSITFGTNVPYARFHQRGTKNIPARRQAPAEFVAGSWRLVTTGPAGRMWAKLRRSILKYIRTGRP